MTNVDLPTSQSLAANLSAAQMSTNLAFITGNYGGNMSLLSAISQGLVSLSSLGSGVTLASPVNYTGA